MIEIKHLRKTYGNTSPIEDINLTINEGDIISVIGPSGTGKSTLLRCINLLETPTSGEIIYKGKNVLDPKFDVNGYRKKINMVFQSFNLFSHLTVIENVMKPQIDLLKKSKQEAFDKAKKLLVQVGLYDKKYNYPDELSGGQKQRVAIARTLAMDPELILFDEPTSSLDPSLAIEVLDVIADLASKGKSMLIVTHEMEFAKEISTRVIYIDEGKIYEEGNADEIFLKPKLPKTKQFILHIQTWSHTIESIHYDYAEVDRSLKLFLKSQHISEALTNKIILVVEAALNKIICGKLDQNNFKTTINVEVSRNKNEVTCNLIYEGIKENPFAELDKNKKQNVNEKLFYSNATSQSNFLRDIRFIIK